MEKMRDFNYSPSGKAVYPARLEPGLAHSILLHCILSISSARPSLHTQPPEGPEGEGRADQPLSLPAIPQGL